MRAEMASCEGGTLLHTFWSDGRLLSSENTVMAFLSQRAVPGRGEKLGTMGLREAIVHPLHFIWAMPFISHRRDCISEAADLRTGSRQRLMRNPNPLWNVGRSWGLKTWLQ